MAASGYSGTPLAKKLSLRDGMRVWFDAMPEHVIDEIDEYALELTFVADPAKGLDAAHVFVTERAVLEAHLSALRHQKRPRRFRPTSPRTRSGRFAYPWGWSIPRSARSTRPGLASSW